MMKHTNFPPSGRLRPLRVLFVSVVAIAIGAPAFGQAPPYPQQYPTQASPAGVQQAPTQPLMMPAQLDNLVAPIALYPDPLLGQVLAASTYPLELVEANQFVQQNSNLRGQDLMNAAREQNWDPSVQAMVAFPDVLTLLTSDVRWTTDLGDAFLAQQQDLMAAVQRMRVRAQSNGRLYSNPQQTVTTQTQNGQSAVEIEPANPDFVDVPDYNPDYVWGPPVDGLYPPLWYPPVAYGFGFDPGIYVAGFFPGWGVGWGGWGTGWGWGCGWFGGGLFVNTGFFNHWGFHEYFGSRYARGFGGGRFGWEHDPFHRAGVSYANRGVAARFNSSARFAEGRAARASSFNGARGNSFAGSRGGTDSRLNSGFNGARSAANNNPVNSNAFAGNRGGSAGSYEAGRFGANASAASRGGYAVPNNRAQSFRGNAGAGFYSAPRSFASPGASAPRSSPGISRGYSGGGFSAPRASGGGGFSGGGARSFPSGGGHSSGGGGGGHSGGHR